MHYALDLSVSAWPNQTRGFLSHLQILNLCGRTWLHVDGHLCPSPIDVTSFVTINFDIINFLHISFVMYKVCHTVPTLIRMAEG